MSEIIWVGGSRTWHALNPDDPLVKIHSATINGKAGFTGCIACNGSFYFGQPFQLCSCGEHPVGEVCEECREWAEQRGGDKVE